MIWLLDLNERIVYFTKSLWMSQIVGIMGLHTVQKSRNMNKAK